MNIKAVLKITSPVILVVGISMFGCTVVSLIYNENPLPLIIGGVSTLLFWLFSKLFTKDANLNTVGVREGCAIATFSWVLACLFGAIPFYTMGWLQPEIALTWTKSYYEAMSGFTTTGASILTDVTVIPKGIMFWRSFTHWLGGMGIVVLAVAILPKLGIGGMQAFRMESPGPLKSDKLVPRISESAKILYKTYTIITIVEIILLLIVGVDWFNALGYSFGSVGTGGFGLHNNSVAGLNNVAAEYIIAFFMYASGVNFALWYVLLRKGDIKSMFKDTEFRVYSGITIIAIVLITASLVIAGYNNWGVMEAFRYTVFAVPTVLTTTGYATYDYSSWPIFGLGIIVVLMFIGGSTGSTGGGLKVLRHIINFKAMKNEIIKIVKPNLVAPVKVSGRFIDTTIVNSVMALTLIYLATFVFGALVVMLFNNVDVVTAFTASIANIGNVGPGIGPIVGPAGNYSSFHPVSLWTLTLEMLVGRLEIFTVFALFIPSIWLRKKRHSNIHSM